MLTWLCIWESDRGEMVVFLLPPGRAFQIRRVLNPIDYKSRLSLVPVANHERESCDSEFEGV